MKPNLLIPFFAAGILTFAFLNAAGSHAFNQDNGPALEQRIRNRIDNIKIIDTHEHQGFPYMNRHNCFDISMYMIADLISSGMPPISDSMEKIHDPEAYWNHISPYLKFSRATSYHAQFIQNLKQMYVLKGDELTKDEFLRISSQIDRNFKNYAQWLDSGLNKLNIDFMLVDRVWDPFNPEMEHEKFGYVFRFDRLVTDVRSLSQSKKITDEKILKLTGKSEISLLTLDEYLKFTDLVLASVQKHQAIALKMGLAYHRSLDFAEVTYEKAKSVYASDNKSRENLKELQDFLVYYIVNKAGEADLPIQIHTGYLHGNNNDLNRGNPCQLVPLFRRFPNTRFIIFHGSFPWTGNFIAITKNFTNVYADLVWLPQISRTNAINTLHELLDAVPYNKIMWGGDVGKIDETAGSLELAKKVIVAVLAERIRKGWLSEEAAFDICDRIFRENAMEIFKLK
jgi:uncharacterized protein